MEATLNIWGAPQNSDKSEIAGTLFFKRSFLCLPDGDVGQKHTGEKLTFTDTDDYHRWNERWLKHKASPVSAQTYYWIF